jgi:S-formylglutathione hydrolase FrmB
MVSRRTFMLGALGTAVLAAGGSVVAIEDGVVPGRRRLADLAGACDIDAVSPAGPVGAVTSGRFASSARARDVGWSLALPPGHTTATALPVALVLHGHGEDHTSGFAQLKLHQFLAAYVRAGGAPFALAAVDGGDSYWHPRSNGDNPLRMLTQEFLPMLSRLGLRTDATGALGWSMGGYGALLLAREAHRGALSGVGPSAGTTVVAAAASSPALFASYRASASGAFDNAADFARYGDLASDPDVGETPLYVGCGATDAFTAETRRYRANASPRPAGGISKGCHTAGYWRSVAAAQISFMGSHLAAK